MIRIADGLADARYQCEIDQMLRLRKRVFHDRLQWEVQVQGEYERDHFDDLRPLYVMAMNEATGEVVGSLMLLPTTGPNMLADTFPELLPGNKIRSPLIWESSRYCVDTDKAEKWGTHGVHRTSAELLLALCEIGMKVGLNFIVTVIDLRMERILRRLNCAGERIGEPHRYGKVTAIAGLWETNDEMLQELRKETGISESVLEAPAAVELLKVA